MGHPAGHYITRPLYIRSLIKIHAADKILGAVAARYIAPRPLRTPLPSLREGAVERARSGGYGLDCGW